MNINSENRDLKSNNVNKVKSSNRLKYTMIAIIVVLLSFVGFEMGLDYFYTHDSNETVSELMQLDSETREMEIDGLKFAIPLNIVIEVGDKYFTMEDDNRDYVVKVEIHDADFKYLLEHISNLKGNANASYNGKATLKRYGASEYITVETAKTFSKTLIAFRSAPDSKMLVISLINKKNTFDYALLEKFSKVFDSLEI